MNILKKDMDYSLDIDSLTLRMLGYYNKEGQSLNDEKEEIELANELAKRLKASFDNTKDVNNNEEFKNAKENGVFIFRDKYSNLYAYWHKEQIARITNVVYSNKDIKPLPFEYKSWFTPGDAIPIEEINKGKKYLLDYLDYKVGKMISLKADFLGKELYGKLDYVGKDFLLIKDKSKTYHIGNHFCIEIHEQRSIVEDANFELLDDNNKKLSAMGTFSNSDKYGRYWFSIEGESFSSQKDDILTHLPQGCGVVFTRKNKKIKSIHPVSSISECLKLAQSLYYQDNKSSAAKDVIQHILNEFPLNDDAKGLLNEIEDAQEAELETIQKFKKAEELAKNPDTVLNAIANFKELLEQGKKIKDCINNILECYKILLQTTDNEESADIYRQQSNTFIQKNHTKLTTNQSENIRLRYFYETGMGKEYLETTDQILQDPQTDIKKRAKILYLKAAYIYNKLEDGSQKSKALAYAKESIYLNPFNNKSEMMLTEFCIESPTPSPALENIPLYILNLIEYTNLDILENKDIFDDPKGSIYLKNILVNAKQNDPTAVMEYIAALAQNLSRHEERLNSALYLWNRLFATIDNFGYFVQYNLAFALSKILKVSINKDDTMVSAPAWENKKSWKDIINSTQSLSNDQLKQILYVISSNKIINEEIKKLYEKSVNENDELCSPYSNEYYNVVKEATEYIANIYKNKNSISELYETFKKIDLTSAPFCKLEKVDINLLRRLYEYIDSFGTFVEATNYNKKYNIATDFKQKLKEVSVLITSTPTAFGIEGLLGCIQEINNKLETVKQSFPRPDISINLNTRELKKESDGYYTISVTAQNAEDTFNATNLDFYLSSKDIQSYGTKPPHFEVLEGGKNITLTFKIKPALEIDKKRSLEFSIRCKYYYNGIKQNKLFEKLQVYLENVHFVEIERNPYSNTKIFKPGELAFVGREKDIKNIIETVLSKRAAQIIVYGQKRCGKTTLVNAVESVLTEKHSTDTFCFYQSFSAENEAKFYYSILQAIQDKLDKLEGEQNNFSIPKTIEFKEEDCFELFCENIKKFKKYMKDKGLEKKRPILILDEFTVLFQKIKEGTISKDFLKRWKNIQENELTSFATIFVGHDVIPALFEEEYATNATSIIDRYPLTYLDEKAARELIEKPIKIGEESRFDDDAIKKILYYTARSPWFLQLFMMKMVEYINNNHIIMVRDVEVDEVAKIILNKENDIFPSIRYFDHLINSGLPDQFCKIKEKDIEKILRDISLNCKDTEWCKVSKLNKEDYNNFDDILNDLDTRKVIERKESNTLLKIKVGLFKEWLANY